MTDLEKLTQKQLAESIARNAKLVAEIERLRTRLDDAEYLAKRDIEEKKRLNVDGAHLRTALRGMVDNFKPFTLKPIGAPGSSARADQDAQIKAHAEAVAALGAKV